MSPNRSSLLRLSFSAIVAAVVTFGLLSLVSCNRTTSAPKAQTLQKIFQVGGKFADDSMYACLADALAQHIPYQQALELCQTKLLESGLAGFGETSTSPTGNLPGGGKPFDPGSITSSCSVGDPTHSAPSGGTADYIDSNGQNWGPYSWGSGPGYNGMSAAESRATKERAVNEAKLWDKAADAATAAREKAGAAIVGSSIAIPGAQKIVNAAYSAESEAVKKANAANAEAKKDPNANPPTPSASSASSGGPSNSTSSASGSGGRSSSASGSGGSGQDAGHTSSDSTCAMALQQAREFLAECNRNGWKRADCQQLNARMNGCPDPTLILVDPDQGYTCGETPDVMSVVIAYREKCQQLARGVDGQDPCGIPSFDGKHISGGKNFDICSNPRAYVDPDSGACAGTLVLPETGPDIEEIIYIGLQKIGGPIFVLPKNPKPPGWSPRPGPRTGPTGTRPNP